ncbi:MAG: maturation protein [Guiyang fiers-like virus 5]|nr:MAG: maturation protein [Guiyang fiers-like virus 5]
MLPAHNNGRNDGNHVDYRDAEIETIVTIDGELYRSSKEYVLVYDRVARREGSNGPVRPDGFRSPTPYFRNVERQTSLEKFQDESGTGSVRFITIGDVRAKLPQPIHRTRWELELDNLIAKAKTEALNKLRGNNSLQLGADLAEINKTLGMIAQPTISALQAYRSARHGRWGDVAKHLGLSKRDILTGKYPANKWLEYQYGWKPLFSSIYDGYNRLHQSPRAGILQARRSVSDVFPINSVINGVRVVGEVELSARTIIVYKVANPTIDAIDGVGLLNPVSVAWELIPFSFVLDWFAPVGNVLSAATSTLGLECLGVVNTSRASGRAMSSVDGAKNPGSASHELFRMSRSISQSFPPPEFYSNTRPFSTSHVLSALSLIRQLL